MDESTPAVSSRPSRHRFGTLAAISLAAVIGSSAGTHALLAQDRSPATPPAEALKHAYGLSDAFKYVSRSVAPTVVNIRATQRIEPVARNSRGSQPQSPMDDDLLRRFFGGDIPPGFEMLPDSRGNQPRERSGEGSGVIIREDGHIITNNHVIRNASEITVTLADGSVYAATTIGTDPDTDLAVIKIDAGSLEAITIGDSDAVEVGEWVLALGSPFGLQHTVTAGIVSAKGRANMGLATFEDYIQTDAAINPGNSGGPLVGLEGQLVGINTAISTRTGTYAGIGFAIPSNMVKAVADSIISSGNVRRGALGVGISPLAPAMAEYLGFEGTDGVLINEVYPDSAAQKAGIQVGDIVTQINGVRTTDSTVLLNRVAQFKPGESVDVTIFRKGKTQTLSAVLGDRAMQFASQSGGRPSRGGSGDRDVPQPQAEARLGITIEPLTPEIAAQLNAQGKRGVVVSAVESGSIAAQQGLQRGDIIAMADMKPIATVEDFNAVIADADMAKGVALQIHRGELSRLILLKPETTQE